MRKMRSSMDEHSKAARKHFESHHRDSVVRSQHIVMAAGEQHGLEVLAQVLAGDIQPQLDVDVDGEYVDSTVAKQWSVWRVAFEQGVKHGLSCVETKDPP